MKYDNIKFSTIKQLEKVDEKIRSRLSQNIYFLPYVLFLVWLFITWLIYSLRYI